MLPDRKHRVACGDGERLFREIMREHAFDAHKKVGRREMVGVRMGDQQITAG